MESLFNTLTNVKEHVLSQSDTLSYSRKSYQREGNSFSNIESCVKAVFDDYTEAGKKSEASSSIDRMPSNGDGNVNEEAIDDSDEDGSSNETDISNVLSVVKPINHRPVRTRIQNSFQKLRKLIKSLKRWCVELPVIGHSLILS